jgi:DNA-binding beta-propeller fold protein YncE
MGGALQGTPLVLGNTVSTIAGTAGSSGFINYSTPNGPKALFRQPTDITTDGTNYYVSDYGNNAIRKITPTGNVSSLVLSDNTGKFIALSGPTGITIKPDGTTLYVVNSGYNSVLIINLSNSTITDIIGSATGESGSVDVAINPATATVDVAAARFRNPVGITTDGKSLYIADSGNHTIRWIDLVTKAVSTLAGTSGVTGSSDGLPKTAQFYSPARITTDGTSLFVADFNNRTVRKIDILSGAVTTIAGTAGPLGTDNGASDGVGAAARFNQPNGITTDGTNLFVTDSFLNTVRKIVIATGAVTTESGIASNNGEGGNADSPGVPTYYTPIGLTTDGTSLLVVDSHNNTIRKIK